MAIHQSEEDGPRQQRRQKSTDRSIGEVSNESHKRDREVNGKKKGRRGGGGTGRGVSYVNFALPYLAHVPCLTGPPLLPPVTTEQTVPPSGPAIDQSCCL